MARNSQPTPVAAQYESFSSQFPIPHFPQYRGRAIDELSDQIKALKRENRLDEALTLARGCMDAMIQASRIDPSYAMESYVVDVVVILHKQKRYVEEIETIEHWFATGIPSAREDRRLELRKRLAKAREQLARQEGHDSSAHHAEWKRLVEEEKTVKEANRQASSSYYPRPASATSRPQPPSGSFIPSGHDLMCPSFVAVDFETANRFGGASACQVAFVRFDHGRIVDRLTTFLKPPPGWDRFELTYIHGISARDTHNAPSWKMLGPSVSAFIADSPVYAHNASFDSGVWRDLDAVFGIHTMPEKFFCTYRLARRLLPHLVNHKLPTVVAHCAPTYRLNHHRADSDAEACGLIVASFQRNPSTLSRLQKR